MAARLKPKEATSRANPGRRPLDPEGGAMRTHGVRFTDQGWADVLLIGSARLRQLVKREADRLRKLQSTDKVKK